MGAAGGFAIWAATAPNEAWDANPYYSLWLVLIGLIASFGRVKGFGWGVFGTYLGQVAAVYALIPMNGIPIFPAVLSVALFGTPPVVVGALVGAGIGLLVSALRGALLRDALDD
jgi:hypothetical protein